MNFCKRCGSMTTIWTGAKEETTDGLGASVVSTEGTTRRIKNKNGNHSILDVPFPSAIKYYNKFMGGVDKSDQLIGYHRVIHQTKNIGKPYSTICLKSVWPMHLSYRHRTTEWFLIKISSFLPMGLLITKIVFKIFSKYSQNERICQ
jgi:hypothetical protein